MLEREEKRGRPKSEFRTRQARVWTHDLDWVQAISRVTGRSVQSLINEAFEGIKARYEPKDDSDVTCS